MYSYYLWSAAAPMMRQWGWQVPNWPNRYKSLITIAQMVQFVLCVYQAAYDMADQRGHYSTRFLAMLIAYSSSLLLLFALFYIINYRTGRTERGKERSQHGKEL